jgi:hypothetical protein
VRTIMQTQEASCLEHCGEEMLLQAAIQSAVTDQTAIAGDVPEPELEATFRAGAARRIATTGRRAAATGERAGRGCNDPRGQPIIRAGRCRTRRGPAERRLDLLAGRLPRGERSLVQECVERPRPVRLNRRYRGADGRHPGDYDRSERGGPVRRPDRDVDSKGDELSRNAHLSGEAGFHIRSHARREREAGNPRRRDLPVAGGSLSGGRGSRLNKEPQLSRQLRPLNL